MITALFLYGWLPFHPVEIPVKPASEFGIEINYRIQDYQAKPPVHHHERRIEPHGPQPYLTVVVTFIVLHPNEARIKLVNDKAKVVFAKRAKRYVPYVVDFGFTEDVKDELSSGKYTLLFLNDAKKEVSKIVLEMKPDGSFLVNGVEVRKM